MHLFLTLLKFYVIKLGLASSDNFACDFIRATDIALKSSRTLGCDSTDVPNPPICEWHFVRCNSYGDILEINVDDFSIHGNLPSSIGYLRFLKSFSARNNNLTGKLPTQIDLLGDLILLDLSGNSFTGSIPESISALPDLVLFDVSKNSLSGTIPTQMCKSSRISVDWKHNSYVSCAKSVRNYVSSIYVSLGPPTNTTAELSPYPTPSPYPTSTAGVTTTNPPPSLSSSAPSLPQIISNLPTGMTAAAMQETVAFSLRGLSHFDGGTNSLHYSGFSSDFNSLSFNLSMWIQTTSASSVLISLGRSDIHHQYAFVLQLDIRGRLLFWDYGSEDQGFGFYGCGLSPVNTGERTHVAFVRRGLVGLFYVNGVPDGVITAAKSIVYENSDVHIGGDFREYSSLFSGNIWNIEVYSNRAKETPSSPPTLSLTLGRQDFATVERI